MRGTTVTATCVVDTVGPFIGGGDWAACCAVGDKVRLALGGTSGCVAACDVVLVGPKRYGALLLSVLVPQSVSSLAVLAMAPTAAAVVGVKGVSIAKISVDMRTLLQLPAEFSGRDELDRHGVEIVLEHSRSIFSRLALHTRAGGGCSTGRRGRKRLALFPSPVPTHELPP